MVHGSFEPSGLCGGHRGVFSVRRAVESVQGVVSGLIIRFFSLSVGEGELGSFCLLR